MKQSEVYVPIYVSDTVNQLLIKEICAGLEEEGVPYVCKHLAEETIRFTSLRVTIVVKRTNEIAIFHEKLPDRAYLIEKDLNGRKAGQNAARMVKGQPLVIEEE
ncbi:hypothetical protein CSV79_12855 [Sporosarcina sp. P13]|uniref:glycerol dehydratase reactivase beta/small subunit family protein n=1 Tax=Sporosarcina sp. P13 TaxID=2048263 RepID=UPI000C16CB9F|nr:glycerol dehydratase reactivase beta/small subunit family protein [Sporosarcina sp. P13]PIC63227.1 hypothetical protein CSV79_12855 [Sporosarcina sp. P13]